MVLLLPKRLVVLGESSFLSDLKPIGIKTEKKDETGNTTELLPLNIHPFSITLVICLS